MALRIIEDGQHQEFKHHGAVISYTVAGWGELRAIRAECRDPNTLLVNPDQFDEALLKRHVHGWRGVIGANGDAVAFSFDLLTRFPSRILQSLIDAILQTVKEEETEQGNSPSSSGT